MRRGMQGHVALPRGRARWPAWRMADTCTRVILYSICYNVYSTYKHSIVEFKLTFTSAPLFKLAILVNFFLLGLKSHHFLYFSGRVAILRTSDLIAIKAMTLMRWTRGPPHQQSTMCLIVHLSELIQTVDRDNYNGPDSSQQWIFKLINATRSRSNAQD